MDIQTNFTIQKQIVGIEFKGILPIKLTKRNKKNK